MMSVKVAGLWELGWNTPLTESWLWSFVLRDFGVGEWAMQPVTGIIHTDAWSGELILTEYNSIETMVEEFSGDFTRVYVDEAGEIPLSEFQHPEDAVYFFGKAGRTPLQYKRPEDFSIRLVTIKNTGVLWPHQCLTTVLHDRLIKNVSQST